MFVYLPSCNFTAACPESSKKIKAYLAEKEGFRVAACCRPTQKTLTAEDTVLSVCLTCSAITREVSPQAREMSFWEYVLTDPDFPWPDFGGERMTVQDCWRARNKPELQRAVRACMRRMNLEPVELEENYEKTQFDGVWRFNEASYKRNIGIAPVYFTEVRDHGVDLLPPEEQKRRMEEWAKQYTTERVLTYCNACLKGVQMGGAEGVHLMELLTANL